MLDSFEDTPAWFNLTGDQTATATEFDHPLPAPDESRHAELSDAGTRQLAVDTGYTLTED